MRMQSYLGVALSTALVGAAISGGAACKSSDTNATPTGVHCTPGNYVFCRCEDRSEGTHLCRPDAVSFDSCVCDGSQPPPTDDPDSGTIGSTPPVEIDAGPVTGPIIDAKCMDKMGLVAGGNVADTGAMVTDHDAFLATYKGGGMFTVSKSTGLGVRGPITVLPVGTSLVATYLGKYQYMGFTKMAAAMWSTPTSLGDGNADPTKATSTVLLNGQLRAFYLSTSDGRYHVQSYSDTAGWAPDALGPGALAEASGDAGAPVTGKSAPAAAATGTTMTLLFTGDDGTLAREQYSGSWSFTRFPGSTPPAYPATPAIVALDAGGARNELLVYAGSDLLIHVAARNSSNGSWNTPILFDTAASATDFALQALPGGKAMLVYRDGNNKGFYSVWADTTGFGPPLPLVAGTNPDLASVPSVARGQCGSDATIAYAQKDGLVKLLRYTAGTMTGPFDVGGITRATWVGVGELP